jgi:hypothetical protein
MYASKRKCIITFSETLETFLTTYRTKRRSASKISDFLSKVTSFLHLFLIKSTNIYNNRKTWSEKSETSPNILDCIHWHPKKFSHDFKQLVLHVPQKDEHLLVTHNDMCRTCMLQWGNVSSLSQKHFWNFFDNILYQKEELQQNFRFFKQGYKFFTFIPY